VTPGVALRPRTQASPIEKVRSFLLSVLTPAQQAQLDALLDGIDTETDPPPATGLQPGCTEGDPPARDRRRMGRDATPGYGPTDAGQGRPTGFDRRMARDNPPSFRGMPLPGRGPVDNGPTQYDRTNIRREPGGMNGFAGDAALEAETIRARLRQAGCPVNNGQGTLSQLRRAAQAYGVMAFDSAPHHTPVDDSPLDAIARIGSMSYAGHVRHDPPGVRSASLAYDDGGGMNSVASYFPDVAANWMKNDVGSVFAVPTSKGGDDRFPRRRRASASAGAAMAYDDAGARSSAPSISQVFGNEFAAHLGRIGTASR
jgi:hypothetical protein